MPMSRIFPDGTKLRKCNTKNDIGIYTYHEGAEYPHQVQFISGKPRHGLVGRNLYGYPPAYSSCTRAEFLEAVDYELYNEANILENFPKKSKEEV